MRGTWERWTGESITRYGSGETNGKARADLQQKLEADKAGEVKDGMDITIARAYELYFAHVEVVGKLGPTTLRERKHRLKNHVNPRLGKVTLARFTTGRANQLLDELEGQASWPVARNVRNDLAAVLRFAVGRDWIKTNPMHEARKIDEPEKKAVIMDEPMCERVRAAVVEFEASDGRRLTPFVLIWDIMLLTGCRISEAIALHWDDIRLDLVYSPTLGTTSSAGKRFIHLAAQRAAESPAGPKPRGPQVSRRTRDTNNQSKGTT